MVNSKDIPGDLPKDHVITVQYQERIVIDPRRPQVTRFIEALNMPRQRGHHIQALADAAMAIMMATDAFAVSPEMFNRLFQHVEKLYAKYWLELDESSKQNGSNVIAQSSDSDSDLDPDHEHDYHFDSYDGENGDPEYDNCGECDECDECDDDAFLIQTTKKSSMH